MNSNKDINPVIHDPYIVSEVESIILSCKECTSAYSMAIPIQALKMIVPKKELKKLCKKSGVKYKSLFK